MLAKRIIPCLDVKDGMVVKGKNFTGLQNVANPVDLARFYNSAGADELVFYDITASAEGRKLFADTLREVASQVFIPLTVGGGINELSDFDRVLKSGADKVSVNSGAIADPALIGPHRDPAIAVDPHEVDIRPTDLGKCPVTAYLAAQRIDIETVEAGEIVLNSIDTDGVKGGFDLEMLLAVCARVSVPVIASGGAGNAEHFVELFKKVRGVDAGLAASIFHYGEVDIHDLKRLLDREGIPVRI